MISIKSKSYRIAFGLIGLAAVFSLGLWASKAYGEQGSGTPESGSTSYINSLYTALQTAGYGSDTDSLSWGTYWNRIKTSAQWTPVGTATAGDVASGKTFYSDSRTQQTGILPNSGNCPTQAYHDSYGGTVTQMTNCTDAITWITPTDNIPGTEKQDPRSGLIWSSPLFNNAGTVTFNPTTNTGWSWDASGAPNVAVGDKTAVTLCSGMGNGWRLPTQKELMQAYIDGSNFNVSQPNGSFWSATEYSGLSAWYVTLSVGTTYNHATTVSHAVRCVR